MGLSIANTMSPFMGRGAPMTVIKGGFALGLVRNTNASLYKLYFAPSVKLSGLATSSTGFSYKVIGRKGLEDYSSPGIATVIPPPITVSEGSDYKGFVRISSASGGPFYRGPSDAWMIDAEEEAHSARGDLGTVIASDVRIVLYGKLNSLSVDKIVTAGVDTDNNTIAADSWAHNYEHIWPDGTINGWYASEVHIFDNPQLRGHVSAGSAKLFWDC